jgi:hypothetical protein
MAFLVCFFSASADAALTDYGAVPPLSKPPQDQIAANQKLDSHTDKFSGRFAYGIPIGVAPARGASAPDLVPVYAVTSVTANDGRGNSATTAYAYSAGLYDSTYREFRGFGVVTETDPLNAYTITWFHQGGGTNGSALGEFSDDLAKSGTPYCIETYGSGGKLYTRALNKVDEVKLHTNGVYFPFIRQTIKQDYEGNTGYRASAVGYAYNAISNNLAASTGNLLGRTNYGEVLSVNSSAHTFTTTNSTAPTSFMSEGRRVDHAVIDREANTAKTYETTGISVDKTSQIRKENRIRAGGGSYIRDKKTRQLVPVQGTSKVIRQP